MTAARWTVTGGLVAIVLAIGFTLILGMMRCGPGVAADPVLVFELVRDPAAVATLFGVPPCREALIDAQRTGVWLDALGFIPTYCIFLIAALRMASGIRSRLFVAGTTAVDAAALCDQVEGLLLSRIPTTLLGDEHTVAQLFIVTRAKFILLALATGLTGTLLAANPRRVRAITGLAALIAAIATLILLATGAEGWMPIALFGGRLALLAATVIRVAAHGRT